MKRSFLWFMVFLLSISGFSQSIRKNFREMTPNEKVNLLNAFYDMRLNGDLMNDLATFHRDFFNFDGTSEPERLDIHINLPDEPEREIFLSWHRMQMLELELAMQDIYPDLSLVYADWRIEDDETSPLWEESFLGQYNSDWGLNRSLGELSSLPTAAIISNEQTSNSIFFSYSNSLERGNVHSGPHLWVGGAMSSRSSPRDPIFYFHHSFIDKLWQEWQDNFGNSGYVRTSILRYDGTYTFNGKVLPLIDPNTILETNSLGVFYADNGYVLLHNYDVMNRFRDLESFYYQFTIDVANNFTVPTTGKAKIQSSTEVVLKPGFQADSGAELEVKILPIEPLKPAYDLAKMVSRNQVAFDPSLNNDIAYVDILHSDSKIENEIVNVFPNPFSDHFVIESPSRTGEGYVEVFDLLGNRVISKRFNGLEHLEINRLSRLSVGVYFLRINYQDKEILNMKLVKQ